MLETTHPDPLGTGDGTVTTGGLVLLNAPAEAPRRWLAVEPGDEVLFGRNVAEEGVLNALTDVAADRTLSQRHARLVLDEGGAYLVDLGSTNGTWLNGRRLGAHVPTRLDDRDTFRVGASRFAWLDAAPATVERDERASSGLEREAFEQACLTALLRAQRYERPLALLVVSEDITGRPGRATSAAPAWRICLRRDDVLGRLARGEWAVLLPETDLRDAHVFGAMLQAVARGPCACGTRRRGPGELRLGVTALAHDPGLVVGEPGQDGGLALGLGSVRLFLAAAREDRDAAHAARG